MNEEPDEQDEQPKKPSSPDAQPDVYKDTDIPGPGVGIVAGVIATDGELDDDEHNDDDDDDDDD
jgi:hypothetical protein